MICKTFLRQLRPAFASLRLFVADEPFGLPGSRYRFDLLDSYNGL